MQKLLDILLLKVVHRQVFFTAGMRHLQPEDFLAAVVTAAEPPAERLFDEWRDSPDPLQNMHAWPRDADRPAAIVQRVLAVDEHGSHPVPCQNQSRGHADRAGSDDNGSVPSHNAIELRNMACWKARIMEIERIQRPFACRSHSFPRFVLAGRSRLTFCGQ